MRISLLGLVFPIQRSVCWGRCQQRVNESSYLSTAGRFFGKCGDGSDGSERANRLNVAGSSAVAFYRVLLSQSGRVQRSDHAAESCQHGFFHGIE